MEPLEVVYTHKQVKMLLLLNSVYIIWSIDYWKTLNTKESIFIEQCGAHKKYILLIMKM